MKKLSKIKLQNAVVLTDPDLKGIRGGSGSGGGSGIGGDRFRCSCASGVIAAPWEGIYVTTESMINAIEANCGEAGGTCTAI